MSLLRSSGLVGRFLSPGCSHLMARLPEATIVGAATQLVCAYGAALFFRSINLARRDKKITLAAGGATGGVTYRQTHRRTDIFFRCRGAFGAGAATKAGSASAEALTFFVFSNDVNVRLLPVWLLARGGSCRSGRGFRGGRADIRQGVFQTLAARGAESGRIMSFRHHAPGYARDAFQAFCPSGMAAGMRICGHSLRGRVRICRCATFQRRGLGRARCARGFGCAWLFVSPRGCLGTRGVGRGGFGSTRSLFRVGGTRCLFGIETAE